MKQHLQIGKRRVGPGEPVYIVAEMSANHNQDFAAAEAIIRAAKDAGADAVKLQTYTADTLTIDSDKPAFRVTGGTLWDGRTLHSLYQEAYTPWDWQPKLQKLAHELGLDFFSTPFDVSAIDFLERLNVPAHKVASFELVDIPLIEAVARTGKPIIMSTGMASKAEIQDAVDAAKRGGCDQLVLLKCNSGYPAPLEEMNLSTIPDMAKTFGVAVGLSDHTMDIAVPIASVALGACVIEKHFTLDRRQKGPDSSFSLEPAEFRAMVDAIRATEKALGRVFYGTNPREEKSKAFRRSLFAVADIAAGETLTAQNVRSIRPANGLPPKHFAEVLGRKAKAAIERGTPLSWDLLS